MLFRSSKLEAAIGIEKVSMERAPQLVAGRVLVSADALSSALGMSEIVSASGTSLDLSTSQAPERISGLIGVVQEIELGEKPRVLVVGDKMSNGEPNMTWVYVQSDTEIALYSDGVESQATVVDIVLGQTVEVIITGPMNMSYPALAKADKIIIQVVAGEDITEEYKLTGTIKELQTGEATRILVDGDTMLIWLTVSQDTVITLETAAGCTDGAISDLVVGKGIVAKLTGPIMKSYPAQGTAASILIKQ